MAEIVFISILVSSFLIWLFIQQVILDSYHGPRGPKVSGDAPVDFYVHSGIRIICHPWMERGKLIHQERNKEVYMHPEDYFLLMRQILLEQTPVGRLILKVGKYPVIRILNRKKL